MKHLIDCPPDPGGYDLDANPDWWIACHGPVFVHQIADMYFDLRLNCLSFTELKSILKEEVNAIL